MSQNMADSRAGGGTCICIRCFDDLFSYFLRFRGSPEEIEQRHKSKQIDKSLRSENRERKRQVVVLFIFVVVLSGEAERDVWVHPKHTLSH